MARTFSRDVDAPFSSTFTFTTFSRPLYSSASWSTIGPIARQDAHHGAQKSTRTGRVAWRTSDSKVASVTGCATIDAG